MNFKHRKTKLKRANFLAYTFSSFSLAVLSLVQLNLHEDSLCVFVPIEYGLY